MLLKVSFYVVFLLCVVKISISVLHPELPQKMEEFRIFPDLVPEPAEDMLTVIYPVKSNAQPIFAKAEELYPLKDGDLKAGDLMHEEDVKLEPYIFWESHPERLYTLIFTSPDGQKYEPALVWLTVNIPGVGISEGDNVTDYQSPKAIVKDQRYVFLVYEQPDPSSEEVGPLNFDEFSNRDTFDPKDFNVRNFTEKYKLKKLIGANFFLLRH